MDDADDDDDDERRVRRAREGKSAPRRLNPCARSVGRARARACAHLITYAMEVYKNMFLKDVQVRTLRRARWQRLEQRAHTFRNTTNMYDMMCIILHVVLCHSHRMCGLVCQDYEQYMRHILDMHGATHTVWR